MSNDMNLTLRMTADNSGLVGTVRVSREEIDALSGSLGRSKGAAESASDGMKSASEGAQRLRDEMDKGKVTAEDYAQQIENSAYKVAALIATYMGFKQFKSITSDWTDLNARVELATAGMASADAVMQRLQETAGRTFAALQPTAEIFLSNATALNDLGYSTLQQLDYMEALSSALVVSGAKAQQAESVINAMSKAMMAGKLSGDNWNTVLQTGGRVVQALADGLGVSVSQLREMAAAGELTSDKVMPALLSQMETLRAETEKMPTQLNDAFTELQNGLMVTVGSLDQAIGSSQLLVSMLVTVTEHMELTVTIAGTLAVAIGTYYVAAVIKAKLATVTLTTAVTALNVAMRANPIGLVVTALAAGTTALMLYSAANRSAASDTQELSDATTTVIEDQRKLRVSLLETQLAQLEQANSTALLNERLQALGQLLSLEGSDQPTLLRAMEQLQAQAAETEAQMESLRIQIRTLQGEMEAESRAQQAEALAASTEAYRALLVQMDPVAAAQHRYDQVVAKVNETVTDAEQRTHLLSLATQRLNKDLETLRGGTQKNNTELQQYERSLQSLMDRLDPAAAEARRFREETALLERAIKDFPHNADQYRLALQRLEQQYRKSLEPNRALIAAAEDELKLMKMSAREREIEIRLRMLSAEATEEERQALERLVGQIYDVQQAKKEQADSADEYAQAWTKALERVDAAFADAWAGAFDSFGSFADRLQSAFKQLLAELAHQAITRPIIVQMTASLTGQSNSAINTLLGGQNGTGGMGGLNLTDLFGARGIGSIFQPSTAASSISGPAAFSESAGIAGRAPTTGAAPGFTSQLLSAAGAGYTAYGVTQEHGPLAGTIAGAGTLAFGGGMASMAAGGTFASGALAALGPVGWMAIAAGVLFGMGNSSPEVTLATIADGDRTRENSFTDKNDHTRTWETPWLIDGVKAESPFGTIGLSRAANLKPESFRATLDHLAAVDEQIAEVISASELEAVKAAMSDWQYGDGIHTDPDHFGKQMQARLEAIAGAIDTTIGLIISGAKDYEEALTGTLALLDIREMQSISSVDRAREAFEYTPPSMNDAYQEQTSALKDLIHEYDGTIAATLELHDAYLLQQAMAADLAYVLMDTARQVDQLFGNLAERIRQDLMGEQELYAYRRLQVDNLVAAMDLMTDPAQIMETARQIEQITGEMWASLSDDQQRHGLGAEYLTFLDEITALSQERFNAALAAIEQTDVDISEQITHSMDRLAKQLDSSGEKHEKSALKFEQVVDKLAVVVDRFSNATARPLNVQVSHQLSEVGG